MINYLLFFSFKFLSPSLSSSLSNNIFILGTNTMILPLVWQISHSQIPSSCLLRSESKSSLNPSSRGKVSVNPTSFSTIYFIHITIPPSRVKTVAGSLVHTLWEAEDALPYGSPHISCCKPDGFVAERRWLRSETQVIMTFSTIRESIFCRRKFVTKLINQAIKPASTALWTIRGLRSEINTSTHRRRFSE